jgi:hypothetical protein
VAEKGNNMRTITLPAVNKTVSLSAYVAAIRMAKANPDAEFKHGLTCWWPCTGRDIMRQFFDGVTDRINSSIPAMQRGQA